MTTKQDFEYISLHTCKETPDPVCQHIDPDSDTVAPHPTHSC